MKILLIQTAFIGDVILTTPMIHNLKRIYPGSTLHVMVKPEAKSLLKDNPDVDKLVVIDKKGEHRGPGGMVRFLKEIRAQNYSLLLSPHKSHRTSIISYFSGIPRRVGYRDAAFSRLAYTEILDHRGDLPEIRRLNDFLARASRRFDYNYEESMHLYETAASKKEAEDLLKEEGLRRPILLAASSVWPTKRWTPDGFADLIKLIHTRLNRPVALVGGPGDYEISESVIRAFMERHGNETKGVIKNLCGRTGLPGLYSLIKRSSLLVSNDSAPVHVGCAARIPVVAIFGPTVKELGYAPITPESRVAEVKGLYCRPCGTHGAKKCPEKHFLCMKLLSASQVFETIEEVYPG